MKLFMFLLVAAAGRLYSQGGPALAPAAVHGNLPPRELRANDLIAVEVYNTPDLSRTIRVAEDGTIGLPLMKKRLKVAGLMPILAQSVISEALLSEALIVDPEVTVTVVEYRQTPPISVAGAVKAPLTFQTTGSVTLLDAISRAGGLTASAGPTILVSRAPTEASNGSTVPVRRILVKDLIDKADQDSNLVLEGGEEIRIPEVGRVYVIGDVKKPGAFALLDGGETTVLRLLALSEGLLPNASSAAYIYRREGGANFKNEIALDLKKIQDHKAPDVAVRAEDIFYVPENHGRKSALAVLEKVLLLGSGVVGAVSYAAIVH